MNISNLTTTQLNQIISIKEQIESLQAEIDSIVGSKSSSPALEAPRKGKRSAAVRAKMAAAQRARWARINGSDTTASKPGRKKRKMSAAGRAAIVAGQKARWAKVKGNGAEPEPA